MNRWFFAILWCTAAVIIASAQTATPPSDIQPLGVNIAAEDGLTLVGDLYRPSTTPTEGAPALLLLHMLRSQKNAYEPLIPSLVTDGYIVLNVDIRGHGQTGGSDDWDLALDDTLRWLAWLEEQEGVRQGDLGIIGASIGANLALLACAQADACITVIALSPGFDYRGLMPTDALTQGLADKSALLVASQGDTYSADSVKHMFGQAAGDVSARLYTGRSHGTQLFGALLPETTALVLNWLGEHLPR